MRVQYVVVCEYPDDEPSTFGPFNNRKAADDFALLLDETQGEHDWQSFVVELYEPKIVALKLT